MIFNRTGYPALAEVKEPLSSEELRVLRDQLDSEKPNPTAQSQFNYAWGLLKSNSLRHQEQGIHILEILYRSEPSMRRESLYYLSLGNFKTGNYTDAKRYIQTLLKSEPNNEQAQQLLKSIEDQITKDGLIGIGVAGGILAVGVGIVGALVRKNRR